jgi:hypothetical protein
MVTRGSANIGVAACNTPTTATDGRNVSQPACSRLKRSVLPAAKTRSKLGGGSSVCKGQHHHVFISSTSTSTNTGKALLVGIDLFMFGDGKAVAQFHYPQQVPPLPSVHSTVCDRVHG